MKKNNKGFSLVELIVVIAIMAILAAVAIPTFAGFITKANKAADESFASDIEYAVKVALSGENVEIAAINVIMDNTTNKAETITYTVDSTVYFVAGDKTDVDANASDISSSDIATLISGSIDKQYVLKSVKTGSFTHGKVTITFEAPETPVNPAP